MKYIENALFFTGLTDLISPCLIISIEIVSKVKLFQILHSCIMLQMRVNLFFYLLVLDDTRIYFNQKAIKCKIHPLIILHL